MEPIAFVGNDRQVYLLDAPDGSPRRLTRDSPRAAYTWPTWAPGREVLALMHHPEGTVEGRAGVALQPLDGSRPRSLWTAQDGGPVFLYWSPDGARLGLLVQEADNLHVLVAERAANSPAQPLVSGAPLYWTWAPDGSALVAHVGGHYQRSADARVLLLPIEGGGTVSETLNRQPLGFRAPAWEPGSTRVAYAAATASDRQRLVLRDLASGVTDELYPVGDEPAFIWAPRGGRLAVAPDRGVRALYGGLVVIDVAAGTSRQLLEQVLAFFWTPGGDALLCVVLDVTEDALTWEHVDAATGARRPLAAFTPTEQLSLLLAHFDQYAPAVCLCSSEATLLFPHAGQHSRHNGQSTEHADLWLVSFDGPPSLRRLAGGTLGFFAP